MLLQQSNNNVIARKSCQSGLSEGAVHLLCHGDRPVPHGVHPAIGLALNIALMVVAYDA